MSYISLGNLPGFRPLCVSPDPPYGMGQCLMGLVSFTKLRPTRVPSFL